MHFACFLQDDLERNPTEGMMCHGAPFHQQPLSCGLTLPTSCSTWHARLPQEVLERALLGKALPSCSLLAPRGSQPAAPPAWAPCACGVSWELQGKAYRLAQQSKPLKYSVVHVSSSVKISTGKRRTYL